MQNSQLETLKRAYLKIEELQARLRDAERSSSEPIAIIGMGCRFPGGADNPDSFWHLLSSGTDAVTEVPGNDGKLTAITTAIPMPPARCPPAGEHFSRILKNSIPAFSTSPREKPFAWTRGNACCWRFAGRLWKMRASSRTHWSAHP